MFFTSVFLHTSELRNTACEEFGCHTHGNASCSQCQRRTWRSSIGSQDPAPSLLTVSPRCLANAWRLSCKQDDEDVGWSRLSRLSSCSPKWMMWWNLIRLLSGLNDLIAVHTCLLIEGFWTRANGCCCGASRSPTWLVVHFKISNTFALSCVRNVPLKIVSLFCAHTRPSASQFLVDVLRLRCLFLKLLR